MSGWPVPIFFLKLPNPSLTKTGKKAVFEPFFAGFC
jgi:hypothetical protein